MPNSTPRIMITALRGGSGKTIITLGLASAFLKRKIKVSTFKKGPDFIDSGWLSFSSGRHCHNLDSFLMPHSHIIDSVIKNSRESGISLIEGNRGLFDGMDIEGRYSSAELGKLIKSPILIIVDVTMSTRTIAALITGCQKFDTKINIAAVILNRVAGARQDKLIRDSIEKYCGIPVIGSIPKLKENLFPERHMGLVPHHDSDQAQNAVDWARSIVEENIDIETILKIARDAPSLKYEHPKDNGNSITVPENHEAPRIGYIKDCSFWFYYPENLNHLSEMGAELIEIDSITSDKLPELDALYIGGGFPEVRAEALANNRSFRESLRKMIENHLPVYAECGGLIYLGESLHLKGNEYPMVGALPIQFVMEEKPQGHGYTILNVDMENPFYPVGETIKGHEFHYSRPVITKKESIKTVFDVKRGHCLDGKRDGLCKRNLFATYTHIHSGGNRLWGKGLIREAIRYKEFVKKNTKI
jgi:cobyrinic acid a,c-diamide synthase